MMLVRMMHVRMMHVRMMHVRMMHVRMIHVHGQEFQTWSGSLTPVYVCMMHISSILIHVGMMHVCMHECN